MDVEIWVTLILQHIIGECWLYYWVG